MENENLSMSANRLDVEIQRRGLARSRSAASDLIKRGKVTVNGAAAAKASMDISPDDAIAVAGDAAFVSRAGEKLAHALSTFRIDARGLTAIDVGSSTGGFTDCLLRNGAEKVIAIDVGKGQLDQSLRSDPRVEAHEETDIRDFSTDSPADIVVADLSFISVGLALPKICELVKKGGRAIILVKPQFEVGKEIADKYKGVVTDEAVRKSALEKVVASAKESGFSFIAQTDSPIEGEKGNKEYLVLLKR
ncbi:MAG TPA: TlyA family RNA methyltransferase [Candidatus Paceibacterota bacterium]|nr:TlyA family RNA methyltransferase [Candidatus Paceibacterota bacterium]